MTRSSMRSFSRFVATSVCALVLGLGNSGCSGSATTTASVTGIVAPAQVIAGSDVEVVIEGLGAGDVSLEIIDAFAATTLIASMNDGRATVALPPALVSTSGLVTFVARGMDGDEATSVLARTAIVPEDVAASIDIHAGPRTIVADGVDQTMVTAIAADRFGNPLSDGESVIVSLIEDSSPALDVPVDIELGVAGQLIASNTTAGSVEVFATADNGVSSRRVEFEEVPGSATSPRVVLPASPPPVADGRSIVDVSTSVIADRFGNRIPDGHSVQLRSDGPNGVGIATATTIDGVARFGLLAPSRPGAVSMAVIVDGAVGEAAELTFEAAVSSIPVELTRDASERVALQVGPVVDDLGALVVDGTPVIAEIGDRRPPIEVPLVDGVASIEIGMLAPGTEIEVEVLGVGRTVSA